jgi:hypothetical protein
VASEIADATLGVTSCSGTQSTLRNNRAPITHCKQVLPLLGAERNLIVDDDEVNAIRAILTKFAERIARIKAICKAYEKYGMIVLMFESERFQSANDRLRPLAIVHEEELL